MVTRTTPITVTDLAALATLANTKLAPRTPYAFPAFAGKDKIGLPDNVTGVATYGGAGQFPTMGKITFNLFAYKTIAGTKYYTWIPLAKGFYSLNNGQDFSMKWGWVSVVGATAPDGYIADITFPNGTVSGLTHAWRDIGNVQTLTEDGSFSDPSWQFDSSLRDQGDTINLPCGHGIWLKTLNRIHKALLAQFDIYGGGVAFGDTHKVSGPWNVSVGQKCYLYLLNKPAYKNLQFLYSESDSITGNHIAPEADMLDWYFGASTPTNNLNFGVNGKINGRIALFSSPAGQNESDWTLSSTPSTGITTSFNPSYFDPEVPIGVGRSVTAMIFDLVDVPYVVGVPLVLTATPSAGGTIISDGTGGRLDIVFTADEFDYTANDTKVIHLAGPAAKSVDLANSTAAIAFTPPVGGVTNFAAHWRAFVDGVFRANTLPTLGMMQFVDQDLPNYLLSSDESRKRAAIDTSLDYIASVDNRGALWPVFKDTDFTPDNVFGSPIHGSKAWQESMNSKFVATHVETSSIPPSGLAQTLTVLVSNFISSSVVALRFLLQAPISCVIYAKAGALPTVSDFDFNASANTWVSAPPGFTTDTTWYFAVLNNGLTNADVSGALIQFTVAAAPNGTFFPTDGFDNPLKESISYHLGDPTNHTLTPVPLFGYNVWRISVRRQPDDTGFAPDTGTTALAVKIGLMVGFSFDSAGVFTEIETITIPAGQAFKTVELSLSVVSGAPIACQCDEIVIVRADVNFQPMMHSLYNSVTKQYNGQPWYDKNKAMLFFQDEDPGISVLPLTIEIYNDLENLLNTL